MNAMSVFFAIKDAISSIGDYKITPIINSSEIDKVQIVFEDLAMELTHKNLANPFPIKSQGEFIPQ